MPREFIDRDRQLPPDPRSASGVNSAGNAQMESLPTVPRGEPPKAFDVRATYDSRPVQGFDYNIPASVPFTLVAETGTTVDISFTVPTGYVAVQRKFRHWFSPAPAITSRNQCRVTFLVSGSTIPYNMDIPIGLESDNFADGFFIADEKQSVTARVTVDDINIALVSTLYVVFYGNLILKTGVPSPFEVANPTDKIWLPPRLQPAPLPAQNRDVVVTQAPAPVVMQTLTSSPPASVSPPPPRPFSSGSAGRSPIYDRSGKIIGYR